MTTTIQKETVNSKLSDAQCVYELGCIVDELRELNECYGPNLSTSRAISRAMSLMEHFGVTLYPAQADDCGEA